MAKNKSNCVKSLREARKWTQWQLAQISRLSERTIQRIESGAALGQTAEIALANAFEVDITDLYQQPATPGEIDFIFLKRLTTGAALLDLMESAEAGKFELDTLAADQVELISDFVNSVQMWALMWAEVEAGERVKARERFSAKLGELESCGLWVFGARSQEQVGDDSAKQLARLTILKSDNPRIIRPGALREFGEQMCGITALLNG